jgi:hypothetical protein
MFSDVVCRRQNIFNLTSGSSFRHQSEAWFAAALQPALLSAFLFIFTYDVKPTSTSGYQFGN